MNKRTTELRPGDVIRTGDGPRRVKEVRTKMPGSRWRVIDFTQGPPESLWALIDDLWKVLEDANATRD